MNAFRPHTGNQNFALCASLPNPFHDLDAFRSGEQRCLSRRAANDVSGQCNLVQLAYVMENFGFVEIALMVEAGGEGGENAVKSDRIPAHSESLLRDVSDHERVQPKRFNQYKT